MKLVGQSTARFSVRVALPALLIFIGSILIILLSLKNMANEVDRSDAKLTEAGVTSALHALQSRLFDTHGDYAVWDDAALHLYGTVDQEFVLSNFRDSTKSGILFNLAYLLDEQGKPVFAFRAGEPVQRGPAEEFGMPLRELIAKVESKPERYDAQVGLMKDRAGQIALVAVGSVFPVSDTIKIPQGPPRLLVIAKMIDDGTIRKIGEDFQIPNLALAYGAGSGNNRTLLKDPTGQVIGAITWDKMSRGDAAYRSVAPTAYLISILLGVTILFLLGIGYQNLLDLHDREGQALQASRKDGLTGLANRIALTEAMQVAMEGREGQRVAAIYLDLDGFKEVNDSYGHEVGDKLLKYVAKGFQAVCANIGILARVGGDEFAVLIHKPQSVADAEEIGNRLVRLFHVPIVVDGRPITMGTSVGVAIAEKGEVSAEELLRRADAAMYQAKQLGRNRVAIYDASIDAARLDRTQMAEALREAIGRDALQIVYQPIYDVGAQRPVAVEALLRWPLANGEYVSPDTFIAIAEQHGLIEELGEWVLRRACVAALAWPQIRLSVNVSPIQFRNPRFDKLLQTIMTETRFPASRLELEMTETHLVAYPERAQNIIATLRLLGVTIALDDFGTGYSSIGYLRRFSFDKVKLDRSLVHGVAVDEGTRRLCEATIALAHALDVELIAEGVETEAEAEVLRQAGCQQMQGYLFARPMPAEAVTALLARADGGWRRDETVQLRA